jgi:DNA repair exonuclease SbcCD nuclease subunit
MRFAHLADTHLGYRQYNLDEREKDFYDAFHECVDKIIERDCAFVVHSGDLFDEPRPHVRALVEVRKGLERLHEAGIPFICIAGNHDILLRKGAVPPQRVYRHLKLLTPKKPWMEIDGVFVGGLPYHSRVHAGALKEGLKDLAAEAKEFDRRILLLHQGVFELFSLEYEVRLQDIPDSFDYYALGHIHSRIEWDYGRGKMCYPGSTEVWRIDEVKDYDKNGKGFNIVDTADWSVERVDLGCIRPFIRIEAGRDLDILDLLESLPEGKKPVLHLTVEQEPEEYQKTYRRLLQEVGEKALHLDVKRKPGGETTEARAPETVEIKVLMDALLEKRTDEERAFAYEMFKALSKGEMEKARERADHFYREVFR